MPGGSSLEKPHAISMDYKPYVKKGMPDADDKDYSVDLMDFEQSDDKIGD